MWLVFEAHCVHNKVIKKLYFLHLSSVFTLLIMKICSAVFLCKLFLIRAFINVYSTVQKS